MQRVDLPRWRPKSDGERPSGRPNEFHSLGVRVALPHERLAIHGSEQIAHVRSAVARGREIDGRQQARIDVFVALQPQPEPLPFEHDLIRIGRHAVVWQPASQSAVSLEVAIQASPYSGRILNSR